MVIMQGAEPYFSRGNSVGCLCLHGFTASPHEQRWMGEHLAGEGFTVYVPRLAGHGTRPEDLSRTRWHDWYASALDGYHILRQQCERVFVVGLSMGGLLTLLLGIDQPIDGACVLGAPLKLQSELSPAQIKMLRYVRPYTDQTDRSPFADYIRQQQAQRGEAVLGRIRYGKWSTAGVVELLEVMAETQRRLSDFNKPLLLVYSENDATVHPESCAMIQQGVGSKSVQAHMLKQSGHILTQDIERETVFQLVSGFIRNQL